MLTGFRLAISGIALLSVAPANASELNGGSSATMTITVTIPPFLAALAAQQEGAVGLWTVTDDKSALMIKTPDTVVAGQEGEAAIYSGSSVLFSLLPEVGTSLLIKERGTTVDNGLRRQAFSVMSGLPPTASSSPATIVVSAI